MSFLRKRWVAWTLCILMIIAALGIGQAKETKRGYDPSNAEFAEDWGAEHYASYTRFVKDESGLLSGEVIRMIASHNAALDYSYDSILGIGIIDGLGGRNMEDAAYDMGYEIGLGEQDYFLLLDTKSKDYWFVSGDDVAMYVDHQLEIVITENMAEVFTDPEDAFEDLFDDLEDWYRDHIPVSSSGEKNVHTAGIIGGSVFFVFLITVLIMAAVISACIRTTRRFIRRRSGFWPLLFIGNRFHRNTFNHGTPPGPGPMHGHSSFHRNSGSFGRARRGSSFGHSRSGGGSFGGNRRGGSFGGKR